MDVVHSSDSSDSSMYQNYDQSGRFFFLSRESEELVGYFCISSVRVFASRVRKVKREGDIVISRELANYLST